jgi:serine/threonine protein kinase
LPAVDYGLGDVVAGRYQLVEPIGAGGFGTVFQANDLIEGRLVALKVLKQDDDVEVVRREFLPLQRLDHPNIVKAGQPAQTRGGRWVIPFELIEGSNLRDRLVKDGPLGADELRDLGTQLLAALSTIHPDEARIAELERRSDEGELAQHTFALLQELKAHGLVHRDIKPENLMIRGDGTVVLVDFGISSRAGTQAKTSRGTYAYWPPDLSVVALDRWGPDIDRYAAGATLFEAACGVLPYLGVDRQEDVAELHAFRSDLPVEVSEFFLDACWPRREDRFTSTVEMAKAWQDAWTKREAACQWSRLPLWRRRARHLAGRDSCSTCREDTSRRVSLPGSRTPSSAPVLCVVLHHVVAVQLLRRVADAHPEPDASPTEPFGGFANTGLPEAARPRKRFGRQHGRSELALSLRSEWRGSRRATGAGTTHSR